MATSTLQKLSPSLARFVDENPDLAFMVTGSLPESSANNSFIKDVAVKLIQYGNMSERQAEAVRNSLRRDAEYAAQRAAQSARLTSSVVSGRRVVITGEVVSVKTVDSMYGPQRKMRVIDDRGFMVYGSVPKAIYNVSRGERVTFLATEVKPSDNDPTYGYFSRPVAGTAEIL